MEMRLRQKWLIWWCFFATLCTCAFFGTLLSYMPSEECPPVEAPASRTLEPNEQGWYLWRGFLEIANHCLMHDEVLECVEFENASKLSVDDCRMATNLAELVCTVIGAPLRKEAWNAGGR